MTPTDDERRTIATGLRHTTCNWTGMGWELYLPFVGLSIPGDRDKLRDAANRLADLIDPGESGQNRDTNRDSVQIESPAVQKAPECDREALLALADEMERDGRVQRERQKAGGHWFIDGLDVMDYARRIREACGEVDV